MPWRTAEGLEEVPEEMEGVEGVECVLLVFQSDAHPVAAGLLAREKVAAAGEQEGTAAALTLLDV